MTLKLDWPPEIVERVKREAEDSGLTVDQYLLQTLQQAKADADRLRQERQEAADEIRRLRKGNILGPDLTIRDLIEEGRRF